MLTFNDSEYTAFVTKCPDNTFIDLDHRMCVKDCT